MNWDLAVWDPYEQGDDEPCSTGTLAEEPSDEEARDVREG